MKRSLTLFFQTIIVLIGIATLALLLWEPHIEGRNANATTFEIYFNDPFLAYAYIASIPFFVALAHAFKVLGYVRQNQAFSQASIKALQTIKYCMIATIGFVIGAEIFIISAAGDNDDRPAGVMMGLLITLGATAIATTAAKFEQRLRKTAAPQAS
jgi:hypothetical protein